MSNFVCLTLLAIIFIQVQSQMSLFISSTRAFPSDLACLKRLNFLEEAFLYGSYSSRKAEWITDTTLEDINQAGTVPHLVASLSLVQNETSPQFIASRIVEQLSKTAYNMVWIGIQYYAPNGITCDYVQRVAKTLEASTKRRVGIMSNLDWWVKMFGDSKACPQLAEYALFHYDSSNPVRFGGWSSSEFALKGIAIVKSCNNYTVFTVRR